VISDAAFRELPLKICRERLTTADSLWNGSSVSRGESGCFLAVLADVVSSDVGVQLANGGEGDFAHDRVAELGGEDAEVSGAGRVVVAGDNLGEDLAAEAGDVRGLTTAVGAGHSLPADDVESAPDDCMTVAESIITGVLVEKARQQPRGEIGSVGLVEEAAPGVGVEAVDAFAEDRMGVKTFGSDGGQAEKDEGRVVGGLVGGDLEVIDPAGWMRRGAAGDGAEVGHEAKDALRLLPAERDRISVSVQRNVRAGRGVRVAMVGVGRGLAGLHDVQREGQVR
jgi:hypothetical protein